MTQIVEMQNSESAKHFITLLSSSYLLQSMTFYLKMPSCIPTLLFFFLEPSPFIIMIMKNVLLNCIFIMSKYMLELTLCCLHKLVKPQNTAFIYTGI